MIHDHSFHSIYITLLFGFIFIHRNQIMTHDACFFLLVWWTVRDVRRLVTSQAQWSWEQSDIWCDQLQKLPPEDFISSDSRVLNTGKPHTLFTYLGSSCCTISLIIGHWHWTHTHTHTCGSFPGLKLLENWVGEMNSNGLFHFLLFWWTPFWPFQKYGMNVYFTPPTNAVVCYRKKPK